MMVAGSEALGGTGSAVVVASFKKSSQCKTVTPCNNMLQGSDQDASASTQLRSFFDEVEKSMAQA